MGQCRPGQAPVKRTTLADLRGRIDIELDPRAAGYDPTAVRRMGVNAFEVWAAEPRDEAWARAMEPLLRPRLEADLAVMVTGPVEAIEVECHSATCKVSAIVAPDTVRSLNRAFSVLDRADETSRDQQSTQELPDGRVRFSVILAFTTMRDPTRYLERQAELRPMQLQSWRARLERSEEHRSLTPALPDR